MASIHAHRAMEKAASLGGYAGDPDAGDLWELPKRELIEIALRLGELCSDDGGFEGALERVREERRALRANGIL